MNYTTFFQPTRGGFYFRVLGYGLALGKDRKPRFSERYGYRKVWRWRRWDAMLLTPAY
jgi:hypothetical protein